uniref:Uncharacterized protein n=1 Tax=Arundo donax TaxID=35708 RepID=A0A0A8YB60_ARUDO
MNGLVYQVAKKASCNLQTHSR